MKTKIHNAHTLYDVIWTQFHDYDMDQQAEILTRLENESVFFVHIAPAYAEYDQRNGLDLIETAFVAGLALAAGAREGDEIYGTTLTDTPLVGSACTIYGRAADEDDLVSVFLGLLAKYNAEQKIAQS